MAQGAGSSAISRGASLARHLLSWEPMSSRLTVGCLVALVGVCACGGVSQLDQPRLGDGTGGGADSAGRAGNASGGQNAGGGGAGGAGMPAACAQFKDGAPQSASVVIVNDTLAPIYIGPREQTCGARPLFEVHDASNAVVAEPDTCGTPCEGWLAGEPIGGCNAICLPSEVTKLDAGERISIPWSALYQFDAQLPSACNTSQLGGGGPVSCSVAKRIEPGSYTFYAVAGSDYACGGNPSGCGECVPGRKGGCVLRNAIVTGADHNTQAFVPLDPGYGISGSAGNANMSGAPLPIELVFRRPL